MDNLLDLTKQKSEITKNSKSARDFISSLLDEKSFVETDAFLFTQNDLTDAPTLGEGVVTGYGTVAGEPVYVYCQNFEVLKGGLGKAHADKILKCMRMARKTQTPVIAILNTAGVRLGEGVAALDGYGELFAEAVAMSGVAPQIAVVKGDCFGQMSMLTALSDFTIAMKDGAAVLGAPQVVAAKSDSGATPQEIGGAAALAKSGVASFTAASAADVKKLLSQLVSLLPPSTELDVPVTDLNRAAKLPAGADAKKILTEMLDKGSFLEVSAECAPGMITGLGRLGGIAVGVIANNCASGEEYLDSASCRKAARFVRMLDCYNLPLLSFVNCKGALPSLKAEQAGLVKDAAALMYAISDAEVAKLSVVVGSAVGLGYTVLASKAAGFDYALALDTARISVLSEDAGAAIVYAGEIKAAKNPAKTREAVEKRYAEYDANPLFAAENGSVDNIVPASGCRQYLVSALQMAVNKVSAFPVKKHGNMPL